ncbi:MAG: amidohydrolase family protein [Thaumarchaeota archaeon]|nr:amidohydrolase family protein [Nitrososphaerota archaeon]
MTSATLLQDLDLLLGESFELVKSTDILIESGKIQAVGSEHDQVRSNTTRIDCKNLLAIPGFINGHTHVGDSVAMDLKIGGGLEELVHPVSGAKRRILNKTSRSKLIDGMKSSISDMITCGTTTFVDFREGGLIGVELLKEALGPNPPIRAIILGRPILETDIEEEQAENTIRPHLSRDSLEELDQLLDICDGLGVSGPNEFTSTSLNQLSTLAQRRKKLIGAHAAEASSSVEFSYEHFAESEVKRAIAQLRPNFLVHLTNASHDDIDMAIRDKIPVICCPRANAILGLGFPPVSDLVRGGSLVSLGTDNVMLNSPDILREMDFASKMIRAVAKNPSEIDSLEILKMVTINPSKIFGLEDQVGSIDEGKNADLVLLDMTKNNVANTLDVIGTLVHRVRQDNVASVYSNGNLVKGMFKRT